MSDNLTGRIRYRPKKRLFGGPLLVLQVEEKVGWTHWQNFSTTYSYRWRDAAVEDLMNRSLTG